MASHDCHVVSQELSKQEYEEWLIGHHEAEVSLTNRDELLFQSYLAIEKKLELLGECSLPCPSLHDHTMIMITIMINAMINIMINTMINIMINTMINTA